MFAEAQSALWLVGWRSPQWLFTGDHWGFQIPRGFYALFSGFRGIFAVGGDELTCFLFFPLPKTPNKLGNSHHGTFRVLLKNTEAKKPQG